MHSEGPNIQLCIAFPEEILLLDLAVALGVVDIVDNEIINLISHNEIITHIEIIGMSNRQNVPVFHVSYYV